MTDNAAIVREALNFTPDVVANKPTRKDLAYRALDALVAERDEANVQWHKIRDLHADAVSEVHRLNHENGALEEEARALREALRGYMFGGSLDSLKAALGEDA